MSEKIRCTWCKDDSLYMAYHDMEWGRLITKDTFLFEFLILEGFQAGLSWITILRKREAFREAFDNFLIEQVANYSQEKINALLTNEKIVRNRLKIQAVVTNAQAFIRIQKEFGSFVSYLNTFIPTPIDNHPESLSDIPTHSFLSDSLSKDLKKRGFKFVGTTIIYSFLQATGYINDHVSNCWVRKELNVPRETN